MMTLALVVLASVKTPDRVVVFPDRALVTRVANVSCGTRAPVVFSDVPPAAARDSFRAQVRGGSVDGLSAELVTHEKEFSPKAEALRRQLEALHQERVTRTDELTRARALGSTGSRYAELATQLVSREMSVEQPNPKSWRAAYDAALGMGLSSAKQQSEAEAKLRELERREAELSLELDDVRGAMTRASWTVEVLATCASGSAEVALTYLVGGASWSAAYEARADEAKGTVELSTWATVSQGTGEDWSNVDLVLSTAVPSEDATPPEPGTLKVSAWEKPAEKKVLVRRDEYVARAQAGRGGGGAPNQGQAEARDEGLSVQLATPAKATVAGDRSPARLFVGKTTMKAAFGLRVTPKLYPVAFRVAEVTNQAPWPLLAGPVDSFRATGLVGRYPLERVARGAPFTLSFGLEDSVRVERTVLEELKRDAGLFNNKRRFTYRYRFELANYGKGAVEVQLADHLPVSELSDIAVTVDEKTTGGYTLEKDDGIARWKVALRPQEKKAIDFGFKVEVPSSYDTGGL